MPARLGDLPGAPRRPRAPRDRPRQLRSTPGRTPRAPGVPIRAYLTARLYDPVSAAAAGGRTTDYGGLLLVVDLVDNAFGGVDPQLVSVLDIGHGAQDVRVLPRLPAWAPDRRDVVAAVSVDEGSLWIYDDETHVARGVPDRRASPAARCSATTRSASPWTPP